MRRGTVIALAVLLLAAFAFPLAEASHGRRKGGGDEASATEHGDDEDERAERAPLVPEMGKKAPSARATSPFQKLQRELGDVPAPLGIMLLAVTGIALLGVALLAARRAFRPPPPKLPKKSFAAGRARGVREGIRGSQAALAALEKSGLGDLAGVAPEGTGYRVIVRRGRGVPCEYAAGYLTGLFEAAWAIDVRLEHPACGGKDRKAPCVYEAYPAPPATRGLPRPHAEPQPSGRGRAGAGASTRG